MEREKILEEIKNLVKEYFSQEKEKFIPGESRISLQSPTYGWEESFEAIDSILSTWVTMGKKVKIFEESFSNYIGTKYATMVNSGSSANLIALSILTNPLLRNKLKQGDEVITPATTWVTTVYPIVNVNLMPVLTDVDLDTLNINVDAVEKAITDKTKAIMPVHLLGSPCDIKRIKEIAEDHDLFVIEDACESHGAEVNGKKVGSFGDIGTFSFFFSHHITTIEGGMLVTNNEEMFELSKALRVFGWVRNLKNIENLAQKYSNIDKRYLFVNMGFNFRPTEIQGAFGMHQLKKIENFIKIRQKNADYWNNILSEYQDYFLVHRQKPGTRHSWFGLPITVKKRAPFKKDELVKFLEDKKIETRPIQVPNITKQPASSLFKYRISGDLTNSNYITESSFYFGNHCGIGKEEREYIANCIIEFVESKKRCMK